MKTRRKLWALLTWALLGWPTVCACGPAVAVERFRVTIAMVERCTAHSASDETCTEPDPTTATVPVVVETSDQTAVTLYATDPGDGTDRAYAGSRDGDELALTRDTRRESDAGCVYTVRSELKLTIANDRISGGERRASDEAGACNALGLRTVERTDWSWQGTRLPIE